MTYTPIKKVLIANRGEIALRVLRACKEMGIETVAIHSTADSESMHVKLADESVCIGPPAGKLSYLNMPAILTAAELTGADAIHPGVGFFSENATFIEMTQDQKLNFIGPSMKHVSSMGNKIKAKQIAKEIGLPVVPGSEGVLNSLEEATELAREIGYPVLVKASAGGGGRGIQIVLEESELENAINLASSEAKAAFGNPDLYMEKYLQNPRHIEIQILGDKHGNVIQLGERDCSVQRRHQKIIEETPSPALTQEERNSIGSLTAQALTKLGYFSAGTVEYLYENGEFYFIEMNTRIQVEHPITEMITDIDIVKEQIRIAEGHPLSIKQEDIPFNGHSIECRINAEDPETFMPSPGIITTHHVPGGNNVRVDTHAYVNYRIPAYYDSLIGKLIAYGPDRETCIKVLKRSLDEYVVDGIKTNIPLHKELLEHPDFVSGNYTIKWLEEYLASKTKS